MIRTQIANVYSEALVEAAQKAGVLDAVAKDAAAVSSAFSADESIEALLASPQLSSGSRKEILEKAFAGKINRLLLNTFLVMADKRRTLLMRDVCEAVGEKYDELSGVLHVRVVTAVPLDAAGEKRFREVVERKTGKRAILEKDVRPEVIGGAAMVIGETRIDGTIAAALLKVKTEIMKRFSYGTQD